MKPDLSKVAPGDSVVVSRTGLLNRTTVETVERVTATQLILVNGSRFKKKTGYPVGERGLSVSHSWISSIDPKEIERVKTEKRRRSRLSTICRVLDRGEVSDETLGKIYDLIQIDSIPTTGKTKDEEE